MTRTAGRMRLPKSPRSVLATEIAAFVLVGVIALDEIFQSGEFHLWIGFALVLCAIAGACGILLESRKKSQS